MQVQQAQQQPLTDEEKKSKKRQNLIDEVIETEQTYVSLLSIFVNEIMLPTMKNNLLDEKTFKIIFTNGKQLLWLR